MTLRPLCCSTFVTVMAILAGPLDAQFNPYLASAVNAADYDSTGIAQGSMFVIFGEGLGPANIVHAPTLPLSTTLAGTTVTVTAGAFRQNCAVFYTSSGQVAAVLPSATPTGLARVSITYNGRTSTSSTGALINVVGSSVGMFTPTSLGLGFGIFTDAVDGSLKDASNAAAPGEVLIGWATGLGAISASDNSVPPSFPNIPGVQLWIGNQAAEMIYAGRSGCCVAVDQIAFRVPSQVITGCNVPVMVTSGGRVSNTVTLPIANAAGQCTDAGSLSVLTSTSASGPIRAGLVALGPSSLLNRGFMPPRYLADQISAALHVRVPESDAEKIERAFASRNRKAIARAMSKYAARWKALSRQTKVSLAASLNPNQGFGGAAFGQLTNESFTAGLVASQLPPPGSCVVLPPSAPTKLGDVSRALDAGGALTLTGAAGTSHLPTLEPGVYGAQISAFGTNIPTGTYTISGSGGKDIGPFSLTLDVPDHVAFSNKSSLSVVDRSTPLTITWAGGTAGKNVMIGGYASSRYATVSSGIYAPQRRFVCTEDGGVGTFTVPPFILSAMWPTPDGSGVLLIASHPLSQPISIPGLDAAWFVDGSSDSLSVVFK